MVTIKEKAKELGIPVVLLSAVKRDLDRLSDEEVVAISMDLSAEWFPDKNRIYYESIEKSRWADKDGKVHGAIKDVLRLLIPVEINTRLESITPQIVKECK